MYSKSKQVGVYDMGGDTKYSQFTLLKVIANNHDTRHNVI